METQNIILALMEKGFDMGTKGKITWTREELHAVNRSECLNSSTTEV